jgi:DNA-directed RNA polymerase subunit RPC12/RpoP
VARKYNYNTFYKFRKENHLCVKCGAPAEPKYDGSYYIHCEDCRNKALIAKELDEREYETKPTICWLCDNAVPVPGDGSYAAGCSWSIDRIPVKGWRARRTVLTLSGNKKLRSYAVITCPQFRMSGKYKKMKEKVKK